MIKNNKIVFNEINEEGMNDMYNIVLNDIILELRLKGRTDAEIEEYLQSEEAKKSFEFMEQCLRIQQVGIEYLMTAQKIKRISEHLNIIEL